MPPPSTRRLRRVTTPASSGHRPPRGQPPRAEFERPHWRRRLLLILTLGLLAMLRVSSLARLSELDWENRRMDRLMVAEGMRRAELLRERTALTALSRLGAVAEQEQMVAPPPAQPIRVGALPEPRIYWELPEETGPAPILSGQQVGQLPAAGGAGPAP